MPRDLDYENNREVYDDVFGGRGIVWQAIRDLSNYVDYPDEYPLTADAISDASEHLIRAAREIRKLRPTSPAGRVASRYLRKDSSWS